MVKKEVHESELLFLAQRTKRDSGAEGGGESEANVAVFLKKQRKRDSSRAVVKYFIAKQKHRTAYRLFGAFEYIRVTDENIKFIGEGTH